MRELKPREEVPLGSSDSEVRSGIVPLQSLCDARGSAGRRAVPVCVHTALLPCPGAFLAPHCPWSHAFQAGRDPAVSASFYPVHVHGLGSRQTEFLAYPALIPGPHPLFLPPGMSPPSLPHLLGFKTSPYKCLHKPAALHMEASPEGPHPAGMPSSSISSSSPPDLGSLLL